MSNALKIFKFVGRFTLALVYVMGMAGLYGFFVEKKVWKSSSKLIMLVPIVWPYVLLVAILSEMCNKDYQYFSLRWS